jgi:hypothetical protein
MKTTARVGPSVLAEPFVVWTAPDGSKNVFPARQDLFRLVVDRKTHLPFHDVTEDGPG